MFLVQKKINNLKKALLPLLFLTLLIGAVILRSTVLRTNLVGVPLRARYSVGQTSTSKWTVDGTIKCAIEGLPDLSPPQLQSLKGSSIHYTVSANIHRVVKAIRDQVADIQNAFNGGTLQVTLGTQTVRKQLQPTILCTDTVDARGRVLKTDIYWPGLSAGQAQQVENLVVSLLGPELTGNLECPGSCWTESLAVPLRFQHFSIVLSKKSANRFLDVGYLNREQVARIHRTSHLRFDITPNGPVPTGAKVLVSGRVMESSVSSFAWQPGVPLKSEGKISLDLSVILKLPAPLTPKGLDLEAHVTGVSNVGMDKIL